MLVYLSAPYTSIIDKTGHMEFLMRVAGTWMKRNAGHHVVSPLYNHYLLDAVPELGTDWDFWTAYSEELLSRCHAMLLVHMAGTDTSKGVRAELELARKYHVAIFHRTPHEILS